MQKETTLCQFNAEEFAAGIEWGAITAYSSTTPSEVTVSEVLQIIHEVTSRTSDDDSILGGPHEWRAAWLFSFLREVVITQQQ